MASASVTVGVASLGSVVGVAVCISKSAGRAGGMAVAGGPPMKQASRGQIIPAKTSHIILGVKHFLIDISVITVKDRRSFQQPLNDKISLITPAPSQPH